MGVGIALLVMRAIAGFGSGSSGGDGVGSCWAPKGGTTYTSVPCGSSGAQYRVVATVADPASCPDTSNSYLDTRMVGSGTRYECLAPLR